MSQEPRQVLGSAIHDPCSGTPTLDMYKYASLRHDSLLDYSVPVHDETDDDKTMVMTVLMNDAAVS